MVLNRYETLRPPEGSLGNERTWRNWIQLGVDGHERSILESVLGNMEVLLEVWAWNAMHDGVVGAKDGESCLDQGSATV